MPPLFQGVEEGLEHLEVGPVLEAEDWLEAVVKPEEDEEEVRRE